MNYYNEIEPSAVEWLRNLIAAGHLPRGDVDERSITDVKPEDLEGYRQCHFFGGIGGWPLALRIAGWPEDEPVWTGSCPCQPLSSAGQHKGHADQRHLWPAFQHLIAECQPTTVFGEQVASKDGREWLCGIRADLEHLGYACGCVDMPAASVGAPHIRQRLWWVADANGGDPEAEGLQRGGEYRQQQEDGGTGRLADTASKRDRDGCTEAPRRAELERRSSGLDDAAINRTDFKGKAIKKENGPEYRVPGAASARGFWDDFDIIPCADETARRIEPESFPLAHGLPRSFRNISPAQRRLAVMADLDGASLSRAKGYRIRALRGFGNAIVPQVAAQFIQAFIECDHA